MPEAEYKLNGDGTCTLEGCCEAELREQQAEMVRKGFKGAIVTANPCQSLCWVPSPDCDLSAGYLA